MKISTVIKYGLIVAGALIIAILFLRSCSLYDANSILKGRYIELQRIADADHAILTKEIGHLTNDIAQRDVQISRLRESITVINTALVESDRDLATLRASWSNLSAECVQKLQELDSAWIEKELLYKQEISAERRVTEQWVIKYNNAIKIGDSWKKQYEQEYALRLQSEKLYNKANQKLRVSRIMGNLKTTLIIAAGIYLGKNLIK